MMPRDSKKGAYEEPNYTVTAELMCVCGALVPQRGDKGPSPFQDIQKPCSSAFE